MHGPWASDFIGVGHANVCATVISKIQVVIAKGGLYPSRHPNQRGALDIATHSSIHFGSDDRSIANASDSYAVWLCGGCGRRQDKQEVY